jgi:histone H3/H4
MGESDNRKAYISFDRIMMIKMAELPLAPVTRIIKKAGAERVSEEASTEMKRLLEDYGAKIATNAVSLAKHAGRNTVQAQDIRKAVKHPLLFF